MNRLYKEIVRVFPGYLRDDVIDAVVELGVTLKDWHDIPDRVREAVQANLDANVLPPEIDRVTLAVSEHDFDLLTFEGA